MLWSTTSYRKKTYELKIQTVESYIVSTTQILKLSLFVILGLSLKFWLVIPREDIQDQVPLQDMFHNELTNPRNNNLFSVSLTQKISIFYMDPDPRHTSTSGPLDEL